LGELDVEEIDVLAPLLGLAQPTLEALVEYFLRVGRTNLLDVSSEFV
jgi:hypothetical protein